MGRVKKTWQTGFELPVKGIEIPYPAAVLPEGGELVGNSEIHETYFANVLIWYTAQEHIWCVVYKSASSQSNRTLTTK